MNISKIGDKWIYDFRHNGKRYRERFRTKREAEHAGHERLSELKSGRNLKARVIFHKRFLAYHEKYTKPKISEKTYANYTRLHDILKEEFGNQDIKDITRDEYQDFIDKLSKKFVVDGVSRYNSYIRKVVQDAINEGVAIRDFTLHVRIHSEVKSKEEEHMYLDMAELEMIQSYYLKRLDNYAPSTYLILLMTVTGGRFSDCINLKRSHIDEVNNTVYLDGTKNENAKRTVTVDKYIIKLLLRYADHHPTHVSGYLFTHRGKQITNKSVNESIKKACEELNIKKQITSHAFRHTHISILIYKGVDIGAIAERVGHSSPDITYRKYAHVIKENKDKQNEVIINVTENNFKKAMKLSGVAV